MNWMEACNIQDTMNDAKIINDICDIITQLQFRHDAGAKVMDIIHSLAREYRSLTEANQLLLARALENTLLKYRTDMLAEAKIDEHGE